MQKRAKAGGGRKFLYQVRLTEQERDMLRQRAASRGITVSKLLLDSVQSDTEEVWQKALVQELQVLRRSHPTCEAITEFIRKVSQ